jgi:hypothetical protein
VSLSLSLSSTFIHLPFALNLSTSSLACPFFSSPCSFSFLFSIPSVSCTLPFHLFCPQTLLLSFPLTLFPHYLTCRFSVHPSQFFFCLFSTSTYSFHSQISAPYINILSIMLSNVNIVLLKSPPYFLSPIRQTHSMCLFVAFSSLPGIPRSSILRSLYYSFDPILPASFCTPPLPGAFLFFNPLICLSTVIPVSSGAVCFFFISVSAFLFFSLFQKFHSVIFSLFPYYI